MNFATLQNGIATWLENIGGVECELREGPKRLILGPKATFKITSNQSIGHDWTRYELNDDNQLDPIRQGSREFTLSVDVRSDKQGSNEALQTIEDLRTDAFMPWSKAELETLGIAIVEVLSATDSSYTYNNRRMNRATIDFRIAYNLNKTYENRAEDWVESVSGTGTLIKPVSPHISETFDTDA